MNNYLLKLYNEFVLWVCFVYFLVYLLLYFVSSGKVAAKECSSPQESLSENDSSEGHSEPRNAEMEEGMKRN